MRGIAATRTYGPRTDVGLAAGAAGLGAHRATYLAAEPSSRRYLIEAVGLLLAGLMSLVGVVSGAAILTIFGITGVVLIGGRLLVDVLWLVYVRERNRGSRLDLYERGLVVRIGGAARAVRYDSTTLRRSIVEHANNPAPNQISHSYTVVDTVGTPVVLRQGIEHPDRWGPEIDQAISDAQLPSAAAALAAGGRLDFEYFWMTETAIGAGQRQALWADVTDISVHKGWVRVDVAGQPRPLESLPVSLIPNFTVFLTLAQRLRAAHAAGQ
ncbi:DUF6585 family protein [Nocardia sp. NPDC049149]|uniref:DUF6585 family protein n=1 Tax=Nocardia sp. NPDC049149 TaxID=3364315 RepID=UPI003721DFCD